MEKGVWTKTREAQSERLWAWQRCGAVTQQKHGVRWRGRQIAVGLVEYTRLHYYWFYRHKVVFVALLCIHFLIVLYLSTHLMYAHISSTSYTLYLYTERFLPMSLCMRANPLRCHSFSNKHYITDSLLLSRIRVANRRKVNKWWQTGLSEQADQLLNWQLHSPEIAKAFRFFFYF